ncbi:MAG: hypothetical protein KME20_27220 [Kaiparowitsia implicata GSE-PSE-MK54-09C]|nr:hypothetical protein [Kaiparowitsia implicata GSE-PSE-MK54-09C]
MDVQAAAFAVMARRIHLTLLAVDPDNQLQDDLPLAGRPGGARAAGQRPGPGTGPIHMSPSPDAAERRGSERRL